MTRYQIDASGTALAIHVTEVDERMAQLPPCDQGLYRH
jgi:hypothetical protein